ncbi:MAG: RecQ family ATP-dependent DNA helicase [Treponema sp.]|nr:RecQ family ATP-dependent DNA helicase [Treponema sp.]
MKDDGFNFEEDFDADFFKQKESGKEEDLIDVPLKEEKVSSDDFFYEHEDEKAALSSFGIKYLFPWQRIVISNILMSSRTQVQKSEKADDEAESDDAVFAGRQIVLLPTGAGKSLCFLVPALLLDGPTLVLYPLLALMSDQKRRMDEGGLKSVVFRGGMTEEEKEENFRSIKNGAKVILANPEVLQNKSLVLRLKECSISHIAIDEAHCVSEWGDSFRPAYLTLGDIIKELDVKTVTAFTATASPSVLSRVSEVLFEGNAHVVRSDSDRPNILYKVVNAWSKKRAAFSLALTEKKPLIIFCGTRALSEDMARELGAFMGYDRVKYYHAGLEKSEKDKVEKWFYPKTDAVLCCTCAFGMGVDKKDIRTVIHLMPSPTAESYIQEAGRGGRDGKTATGILLWSREDSQAALKFPEGSRERVMRDFAEAKTCRRQVLLDALGGEKAACSGCDVCTNGRPASFASDAAYVYSFIRKNRKCFKKEELISLLVDEFNRRERKLCGVNVWNADDVEKILFQMENAGMIRTCSFPWTGLITTGCASSFEKKFIIPVQEGFLRRQRLLRAVLNSKVLRLPSFLRSSLASEASSGT